MGSGFHHEAVFYASDEEYVAALMPDLRAAATALVAVSDGKAALLRAALGADADRVRFTDMEALGRNPACIIPAWREFLAGADPGPRLGIGEPVWPGRSDAELIECRRHESLLNLAFGGGDPWRLLCPYDARALSADVLADARRNHPHVSEAGARRPCADYLEPPVMLARDGRLPPPPTRPAELDLTGADPWLARRFVAERARTAGIREPRLSDLVLAVNELATNTMRHAAGNGRLRVWLQHGTLVCEVADGGHVADPLAGRGRPSDARDSGRGLWMVNHLCDLVQLRTAPTGTVVRVHMHVEPPA